MPPKICIYKSLFLFKILSEGKLNSLGDWGLRYQFEPNVLRIENAWVYTHLKSLYACPIANWNNMSMLPSHVLYIFFRFRQELLDIGTTIEERNKSRDEFYYYKYLHPSEIPNSISIWVLLWNDALLVINVEVFILSNLNRRNERCGYWINKFFSGSRWLGMIMSNQTIENSWTWNT